MFKKFYNRDCEYKQAFKKETSSSKGFRNAEKNEEDSKAWDAFMDRNRRLMDNINLVG